MGPLWGSVLLELLERLGVQTPFVNRLLAGKFRS